MLMQNFCEIQTAEHITLSPIKTRRIITGKTITSYCMPASLMNSSLLMEHFIIPMAGVIMKNINLAKSLKLIMAWQCRLQVLMERLERTDLIRRRWLDNDFYGVTYNFNYQPESNLTFTLGGAYNEYKGKHFGEIIWAQYASNGVYGDHYYDNQGDKSDFNVFGKVILQSIR